MDNKLIIFDFDGVLVNTEEIYSANLHILLNKIGYKCSLAEAREAFSGKGIKLILEELQNNHSIKVDNHQHTVTALRAENKRCLHQVRAMPLAKEVLSKLTTPYCIASSGSSSHIKEVLHSTGLAAYFKNNYFGGEDLGKHKPDPAVYLHAMEQMNVSPSFAVAIEDSVSGVKAATAANVPVIGFIGGKHVSKSAHKHLKDAGAFVISDCLDESVNIALEKLG